MDDKEKVVDEVGKKTNSLKYVPFIYVLIMLGFLVIALFFELEKEVELEVGDTYKLVTLESLNEESALLTFDGKQLILNVGESSEINSREITWASSETLFKLKEMNDKSVVIDYSITLHENFGIMILFALLLSVLLSILTSYLLTNRKNVGKPVD